MASFPYFLGDLEGSEDDQIYDIPPPLCKSLLPPVTQDTEYVNIPSGAIGGQEEDAPPSLPPKTKVKCFKSS